MGDMHKEAPEWLYHARAKYNDDRFQQLNQLLTSNVSSTWTYLLSVNGGSAAGVLAFIGAKDDLARQAWPYVTLGIFIAGLILVGIAHAFMVHKSQALVKNWVTCSGKYWRNEMPWSDVLSKDEGLVQKWGWVPWVLGWAALATFTIGVAVAAWNFHHLASLPELVLK